MSLTPQEARVAELLARGMTAKAIAKELGCSTKTVRNHITNASRRIEGPATPRMKLALWYLEEQDSDAA